VYEKVAEYLTLIGRTELLTCSATQTSFTRIRDQAQQVSGMCYLLLVKFKLAGLLSVQCSVPVLLRIAADTGVQPAVCVPVLSCAETAHPV
jgi:hypothetical protein